MSEQKNVINETRHPLELIRDERFIPLYRKVCEDVGDARYKALRDARDADPSRGPLITLRRCDMDVLNERRITTGFGDGCRIVAEAEKLYNKTSALPATARKYFGDLVLRACAQIVVLDMKDKLPIKTSKMSRHSNVPTWVMESFQDQLERGCATNECDKGCYVMKAEHPELGDVWEAFIPCETWDTWNMSKDPSVGRDPITLDEFYISKV